MDLHEEHPLVKKTYERLDQLSCIWCNLVSGGNIDRSILERLERIIDHVSYFAEQHKDQV